MRIKNILLALDFSEITGELINAGEALAKPYNANLHLLHTEPPTSGYVYYTAGIEYNIITGFGYADTYSQQIEKESLANDKHALEIIQNQLKKKDIKTTFSLLKGEIAETIVNEAQKIPADLIIIGSHKHGAFYNLLFGSTETKLLKESPYPILIIPEKIRE